MTHTPVLLVIDANTESPHMAIVQRCKECNVEVTRHDIDVSQQIPDGAVLGSDDGYAWLKHVSEGQA